MYKIKIFEGTAETIEQNVADFLSSGINFVDLKLQSEITMGRFYYNILVIYKTK